VNAAPYTDEMKLQDTDEFLIIGSSSFWEIVGYQTAVDIARTDIGHPSKASHRLRNYALACGANSSLSVIVISLSKKLGHVAAVRTRFLTFSIYLPTYLSIYISIYPSIHLSIYIHLSI